jgi:F0F1-type ATP synthase membrane subunit c/vacuolar-type H+-ATPase subunit K
MLKQFNTSPEQNNFTVAWLIMATFVISQLIYIVICHAFGTEIQQGMAQEQRILIRTIFYVLAIATFPLTTLIRHILVRLNQTMPGNKSAQQRYLTTVIVSLAMIESVGIYGFIMFILGDDFNTLYIFSGLAILGFFLQRPKQDEYQTIVSALNNR